MSDSIQKRVAALESATAGEDLRIEMYYIDPAGERTLAFVVVPQIVPRTLYKRPGDGASEDSSVPTPVNDE